jgi:orotate phosphoribosyltransferase
MEAAAVCEAAGATVVGIASLVDRSGGVAPGERPAVTPTALLTVNASAWDPADCPACAAGDELDTPGSRHAA